MYTGSTILQEGWTENMFPLAMYGIIGSFPPSLLKKGTRGHTWFDVETGEQPFDHTSTPSSVLTVHRRRQRTPSDAAY